MLSQKIFLSIYSKKGFINFKREKLYVHCARDGHARFMVTLAELALEGFRIQYTTNRIERLMEKISKRYKHRWMHWSIGGLKNLLAIVLVRYTDEALYTAFKNASIHNEAFI
jgi:hypothetical protein